MREVGIGMMCFEDVEEEPQAKKCRWRLEVGEGKEMDSSLGTSRKDQLC